MRTTYNAATATKKYGLSDQRQWQMRNGNPYYDKVTGGLMYCKPYLTRGADWDYRDGSIIYTVLGWSKLRAKSAKLKRKTTKSKNRTISEK